MRSFFYGILITSVLWLLALYMILPADFWTFGPDENGIRHNEANSPNNGRRLIRRHHLAGSQQHHRYQPQHSAIIHDHDSLEYNGNNKYNNFNRNTYSDSNNHDDREASAVLGPIDWMHEFDIKLSTDGQTANPSTPDHQERLKSSHELVIQRLSLVKNRQEQKLKLAGYKKFAFNLLISNRLGLSRPLPDTRNELCKNLKYKDHHSLPKASIIICHYNEAPSALLRTVYSILQKSTGSNELSTSNLLEIILVDDFSDKEFAINITQYIRSPLIRMLRTPERAGLVRARLFGSRQAKGDVLVFLDSHIEANEDWLRPLLQEVSENNSTVACPIIDIINPNTLQYSASPMVRGGVNWGLHFKWDSVPRSLLKTKEDFIKPIQSPTMAGGLFAVNKKYFMNLGEYDEGMNIWGGENIELSFRVWMCGGEIKIIPCSKVGHIFRHRRPYGSDDGEDTMVRNSLRAALVWMDEYKENFYNAHPESRNMEFGDVSDRIKLRESLRCKNFTWYIDNVYPSLNREKKDEIRLDAKWQKIKEKYGKKGRGDSKDMQALASLQYGLNKKWTDQNFLSDRIGFDESYNRMPKIIMRYQIQLFNSNLCIESKDGILHKGSRLILNYCAKPTTTMGTNHMNQLEPASYDQISSQMWSETNKRDLRLADILCLDSVKNLAVLRKCHNVGSFQEWTHSKGVRDVSIQNSAAGLCLGVERAQVGEPLLVTICENNYEDIVDSKSQPTNSWIPMTNQKWNLLIENPNHKQRQKSIEQQKYSNDMYNQL